MYSDNHISGVYRAAWQPLAFALGCILTVNAVAAGDDKTSFEKWGQSLGGAEALASLGDYHLVYDMEAAGFAGTLEVWQRPDGRRRIEIRLGEVFTHTNIFDGTSSYSSENGRQFQEVAGTDFATVVAYAYMESFSAFLPDRMQAHMPPSIDVIEGVTVCTLIPVNGFSMGYYLNDRYLPDSMVNVSDGRRTVTHYSQWKSEQGVMWPHVQLLTRGDPRFDEIYTLKTVETNVEVGDSLFVRPPEQMSRATFPPGVDKVELSMDLFGNHIFVPVRINGKDTTLWFIFDTGAAISVLNKDRLAHLGIETSGAAEGRGVGEASVEVSFASGVSVDIAGVTIGDLTLAAISLDNFTPILGRPFDGIIGGDIIAEIAARINYRDSTMTLFPRDEFTPPESASALSVSFEGNIPYVEASIKTHDGSRVPCRLYLDTGKRAGISIYHHFAGQNRLIGDDIPSVEAPSGFGVGGQTTAQFIRVPEFSLGGASIENALVAVELGSESRDSANYEQGSLGGDVLKAFFLTIDYSAETVWLERAVETLEAGEMDMLGATIIEHVNNGAMRGFAIFGVLPDSPAEEAGLVVGDVITAIDGVACSEITLPAARNLFRSADGRTLVLSFTRNHQPHMATVILSRMI